MSKQRVGDGPRVAAAFNWEANPSKAERALASLGEAGIGTLIHFGCYGVSPDQYGRDWFAERVEHLCHKHSVTVWVVPDVGEPGHARSDSSPERLLPRGITHQLIAPPESHELLTWLLQRNPDAANEEVSIIDLTESDLDLTWLTLPSFTGRLDGSA
ncbi:MAG: hypothetical protein WED09_05400 [Homoserinimonas sp.]